MSFWERVDLLTFARERLHFHPEPAQMPVFTAEGNRGIICCNRQFGKSTITAVKGIHRAWSCPDSLILLIAPAMRQSNELLRKFAGFARTLGVRPRRDPANHLSLVMPNGSRIIAAPSVGDHIRGFSNVAMILIDEAARVDDDTWHAVLPMLARSDGELWLMSTPKGRRGFFHDIWHANDPSWIRVFATVDDCRGISRDFLDKERATRSGPEFDEDYYCVFQDASEQILATEDVLAAFRADVPALGRESMQAGHLLVQRSFIAGLDLGKLRDHTAVALIEYKVVRTPNIVPFTGEFEQIRTLRLRHMDMVPLNTPYTAVVERLRALLERDPVKGHATLVIDAAGPGGPVLDFLRRANLGASIVPLTITGDGAATSHTAPKRELLSNLRLFFEQRVLTIADAAGHAAELQDQLLRLRTDAHTGDLAMALALAAWRAKGYGLLSN